MAKQKLVILISGRGSNMLAIARACKTGELDAEIALVLSNRGDAEGIQAASVLGLATGVIEHTAFSSRETFDTAMIACLEEIDPDWIVLAGFMRILGKRFVENWQGRILNIHPSLLPAYPGLNTHKRAILAGDKEAGASVHLVTQELDAGPVVKQIRVPILPTDTPDTLAQRVIEQEHTLYVSALKHCIDGSVE